MRLPGWAYRKEVIVRIGRREEKLVKPRIRSWYENLLCRFSASAVTSAQLYLGQGFIADKKKREWRQVAAPCGFTLLSRSQLLPRDQTRPSKGSLSQLAVWGPRASEERGGNDSADGSRAATLNYEVAGADASAGRHKCILVGRPQVRSRVVSAALHAGR